MVYFVQRAKTVVLRPEIIFLIKNFQELGKAIPAKVQIPLLPILHNACLVEIIVFIN